MDRENRRKSKLEKDLKQKCVELDNRNKDLRTRENQLQGTEEENKRCEQQLRDTRVSKEREKERGKHHVFKQYRCNLSVCRKKMRS